MKKNGTLTIATIAVLAAALLTPGPAWAHRRHHHHHHHDGDVAAAAIGGTAMGLMLGAAASQQAQPAQPQVIVVQPQNAPAGDAAYWKEAEAERLRIQNAELQEELERLKAERAGDDVIVE